MLFNRISRICTAQALHAAVLASAAVLILAHSVSSQSAEPPAFVFTAAGDYGLTRDAASTLEGIGHAGGKFHLALGDLSYGGAKSENKWCDLVISKVGPNFPFELISGNHEDDYGQDGYIRNFAACLPDRMQSIGVYGKEYYFDVNGLARFILISPDLTIEGEHYFYGESNKHYNWVAKTIDDARAAHIPWIIVGMHKSCLSVGQYYCNIYQELFSLLVEKKVDLVLQAHDHGYQRTKQVSTSESCGVVEVDTFNPNCVVRNDDPNVYEKGRGPVFVITAAAGGELYEMNPKDSEAGYFVTWMGANSKPSKGFSKFTVSPTEISGEFIGSTSTSTFTDRFTIRN